MPENYRTLIFEETQEDSVQVLFSDLDSDACHPIYDQVRWYWFIICNGDIDSSHYSKLMKIRLSPHSYD